MKWRWQSPLNSIINGVLKTVPVSDAEIINTLQKEGEPSLLAFCDLSPLLRTGIKFESTTPRCRRLIKPPLPPAAKYSAAWEKTNYCLLAAPDGQMNTKDTLPAASVEIPAGTGFVGLAFAENAPMIYWRAYAPLRRPSLQIFRKPLSPTSGLF